MEIYEECKELIRIIAAKIESSLKHNKMSIRKFALLSTIAESTIRSILKESSNIELKTLIKLKLVFSTELYELLSKNSKPYKIRKTPASRPIFERSFLKSKKEIGSRLKKLCEFREINAETLSILSYNINYSDTLKYFKGEINATLLILLKYSHGLEVPLISVLNKNHELPTNKFKGKTKE